jgi:hypothetical protein
MGQSFSKDGSATVFIEGLPVVGYFAAIGHIANGHDDHAKRAAARSTNSTIAVGSALVVGIATANPVLGGMAGAAAGSAVGIGAEHGISKTIVNDSVRGNVGDVSFQRFVVDGALGVVGSAAGGTGSVLAKQAFRDVGKHGIVKTVGHLTAGQAGNTVFARLPRHLVAR